jgi:hypothetical protein
MPGMSGLDLLPKAKGGAAERSGHHDHYPGALTKRSSRGNMATADRFSRTQGPEIDHEPPTLRPHRSDYILCDRYLAGGACRGWLAHRRDHAMGDPLDTVVAQLDRGCGRDFSCLARIRRLTIMIFNDDRGIELS